MRAGWLILVGLLATPPGRAGRVLFADDFRHGLGRWRVEMERAGRVEAKDGGMDIDVPAGVTVWFREELHGPVRISYDATMIAAGGANDRVSDLNCFWMATDPAAPAGIFASVPARTGAFAGYDGLRLYYVGLGGNGNTTTRFRRYIGSSGERPLLAENDISVAVRPEMGLVANKRQHVVLVADGRLVQYWRDGVKVFEMVDAQPYTHGWFGIRTTKSHMRVERVRIERLR